MSFEQSLAEGKLLRISSEDRREGETNDNFTINLNNTSFTQNIKAIAIKSISFKHVFPNIFNVAGGGNNEFTFVLNGVQETVTLATGWYSVTELGVALTNAINALVGISGFLVKLEASPVPQYQRKIVFSGDGIDTFQLLNKADGNAMADFIGIKSSTAEDVSTKTAQLLPDSGGLSMAYVCSPELSSANMAASSNNGENIPVLTEVPVNVSYGSEILYDGKASGAMSTIFYPSIRNISSLSIRLCARNGSALELNQHNFTMVLKILY